MIAANDGVIELETDKAVVEIPCPHAGKVAKVHVSKGETSRSASRADVEGGSRRSAAEPRPVGDCRQRQSRPRGNRKPRPARAAGTITGKQTPRAGRHRRPARQRGGWPANWASIWRRSPAAARAAGSRSKTCRRPPAGAGRRAAAAPRHARPARHAASRPCRRASRARTPGARSAASGCRGSAAPSPRRWSSRPARSRTSPTSTTPT